MRALADSIRSLPKGVALLEDPISNRGTAFTPDERTRLGLDGLLPPVVETLEQQCARAFEAYRRKGDNLERHMYLRAPGHQRDALLRGAPPPPGGDGPGGLHPGGRRGLRAVLANLSPAAGTLPLLPRGGPARAAAREPPPRRRGRDRGHRRRASARDRRPGRRGMGISIGKLQLYTLFGGVKPSPTSPSCSTSVPTTTGSSGSRTTSDGDTSGWAETPTSTSWIASSPR